MVQVYISHLGNIHAIGTLWQNHMYQIWENNVTAISVLSEIGMEINLFNKDSMAKIYYISNMGIQ